MCNFWLIPMDFRICNFRELQSEWIESHVIRWQVPGTPMKYRNGAWKKPTPSSMAAKLKLGDVLYFYVCNLPSDDGEKLSRVLLRGVVKDEPGLWKSGKSIGIRRKRSWCTVFLSRHLQRSPGTHWQIIIF